MNVAQYTLYDMLLTGKLMSGGVCTGVPALMLGKDVNVSSPPTENFQNYTLLINS